MEQKHWTSTVASQAGQDVRRRVSACFVAVEVSSGKVAGYYTLAAGALVPLTDLPADLTSDYRATPASPRGRVGLAVDKAFQGQQSAARSSADAALRAARSEVAVFALIVDAKDDAAVAFYRHLGFEVLGGNSRQLIIPIKRFKQTAG